MMKKVLLLAFLLACVAQAAILPVAEKGSDTQVILTSSQSNKAQLLGTGKADGK